MNWNSAPGSNTLPTLADSMSNGALIGPPADSAISAPVDTSVTTWPSARVNIDKCDRSQRPKASLMASVRSMKVCDGPTAKMRPGHGQSSSPRPPISSTVTDNHVRAILRGWHAPPDMTAVPVDRGVAINGPLLTIEASLAGRDNSAGLGASLEDRCCGVL